MCIMYYTYDASIYTPIIIIIDSTRIGDRNVVLFTPLRHDFILFYNYYTGGNGL